jgi:branched-chain amino acid transport system permease protein
MDIFLQLLLNGLSNGCAFALVALGFALIYNTTRIFHFAHGGIYVLSVYLFYSFYTQYGLPIWLALPITLSLAALVGILIDLIIYRPLDKRGATTTMHMLSSLGLYIIIVNVLCMIYGNQSKILVSGLHSPVEFGGMVLNVVQIATAATFIVIFISFLAALRYSSLGIKLRAMRDNPVLLSLNGINPHTIRLFVFGAGSALCALASVLVGLDVGIDPHIGMTAVVTAAVALIVGGLGNFKGAPFGALLLGCLQSIAVWQLSTRWQDMVTFLVLVLFLLFCPQGIFGRRGRLEEGGHT